MEILLLFIYIFLWFSDLLNLGISEKKNVAVVYILFENIIKINGKDCVRGHSSDTFLKINSIDTNKRQLINNIFFALINPTLTRNEPLILN